MVCIVGDRTPCAVSSLLRVFSMTAKRRHDVDRDGDEDGRREKKRGGVDVQVS